MSRELGLRIVEAVLFSRAEPVSEAVLQAHLPGDLHVADLLPELVLAYSGRGIRLERIGQDWALRTDPEIAPYLARVEEKRRKPSRAVMETLAVIAWKQPVTRGEIEQVRGVALAQGTLEQLLDAGWVAPAGRREVPGRPMTWATTPAFLDAFGLTSLDDLPRPDDLDAPDLVVMAQRTGEEPAEPGVPAQSDMPERDSGDAVSS
ncbi:MAG TPA: SMC-Scp complex subunit ScpB [Geminicoccus sp.]|uniref:SMC-Scp complex subunit ScpB n=1 Tax=Geminicoccus sp. TaxID=2024832 RepID=UPI002B61CA00|nr:SMC-Scp complex subunit ScpB [Geminicoccus sp.]HWL68098.1 SMC-Scp complex subunit ScpB [Geminicoccus sp.]